MAEYFSHDYGSRNDPKLVALQMEMGHEGKGIFWDLVEIMYEQGGYITVSELKGIAFALHTQYERITDVLTKYDLFQNDGEKYWSNSVISRLNMRAEKSEKARKSVLKRWNNKDKDTNVLRTQYEGNTKKERKVKESKEKKVKIFTPPTVEEVVTYFVQKGYTEYSAIKAHEFYDVADWHDTQGNKVRNWKQKMNAIWFKPENEMPKIAPEIREQNFLEEVRAFKGVYPDQVLNSFYSKWSQWDKSKTLMRFEMEKTWDTKKRLITESQINKNY